MEQNETKTKQKWSIGQKTKGQKIDPNYSAFSFGIVESNWGVPKGKSSGRESL